MISSGSRMAYSFCTRHLTWILTGRRGRWRWRLSKQSFPLFTPFNLPPFLPPLTPSNYRSLLLLHSPLSPPFPTPALTPFPNLLPLLSPLLTVVYSIIFIHGLNGTAQKTWTDSKTGTFWPQDLLPAALPHARVMTFGYDSALAFSRSTAGIENFARDLLNRLRMVRSGEVSSISTLGG